MLIKSVPALKALSILYTTYQLHQLKSQVTQLAHVTQHLLHVTTGTAVVAGLAIAVSSLGFRHLDNKLTRLEQQLQALQLEVKTIRRLMEQKEHIMLRSALHDVLAIHEQPEAHRQTILLIAKDKLQQLYEYYHTELSAAKTFERTMMYQEYVTITALATIRCYGELGMFQQACQAMRDMDAFWKTHVRRIINTWLLGESPERFFYRDFLRDVSMTNMVAWLDLAHGTQKGYLWIDDFRQTSDSWYGLSQTRRRVSATSTANQALSYDKKVVIPTLHQLFARHHVLEGYVSQYELLEQQRMTPSELEGHIASLSEQNTVDGYVMLAPEQAA